MSNIINYKSWRRPEDQIRRSQRGDYQDQPNKRLKKIVLRGVLLFFLIYLGYFFFYSHFFKVDKIEIAVTDPDFNLTELNNYLNEILAKKFLLLLPRNNYFWLTNNFLARELKNKYIIEELVIQKIFPKTLKIALKEKVVNLLYQSADNIYLINLDGQVLSLIGERIIINQEKLIKVSDESNSEIIINQKILTPGLLSLILEINDNFNDYLPNLKITEYRVTDAKTNFIKTIIDNGPAIEFTDKLSLEEQLNKLKQSLEQEISDISKLEYINLRVKEQVIYK